MRTATQGASVPAGDGDGLETPVEVSKRVLDWARQQIVDTRTEENGGVREGVDEYVCRRTVDVLVDNGGGAV